MLSDGGKRLETRLPATPGCPAPAKRSDDEVFCFIMSVH